MSRETSKTGRGVRVLSPEELPEGWVGISRTYRTSLPPDSCFVRISRGGYPFAEVSVHADGEGAAIRAARAAADSVEETTRWR